MCEVVFFLKETDILLVFLSEILTGGVIRLIEPKKVIQEKEYLMKCIYELNEGYYKVVWNKDEIYFLIKDNEFIG